ncbi:enamine deaminase RidA (YjgF/YER057c/UK114 family) [Hydromonas duriensis]|uniref:Enamine deaminase RidA (YjgF/YER057c/UK114 family) n=2 Tax=Hydromonas duriensis TaxID=1527608 RepID=A0A4R6Y9A9_9BURK|nr:enamine deaminase RidA (YjgF/YER057c/UK114 family) [Hydromonas duriensis]
MISRHNVEDRYSDMAVYNGVAYLAGQVASDMTQNVTEQTREVLGMIDALLSAAGTDKSRILMAQIYLSNMRDYVGMNEAWDAWVKDIKGNAPPRATVQSPLANSQYLVEIVVTAAVPSQNG